MWRERVTKRGREISEAKGWDLRTIPNKTIDDAKDRGGFSTTLGLSDLMLSVDL
jgi:hypothetical protein